MIKSALKFRSIIFYLIQACFSYHVGAAELLMLTDDGPPHMIATSNSGIDVDITREILEQMGHTVKINYAPLSRNMIQVANQQADLFLPTFFQHDTDKLFISSPIINYRPTIFSLISSDFDFNSIADLAGKNLVTFQGASGYFGDEFIKVSKLNGYSELHDMSKFPEMLIKARCEVVVLDYYIFYYYLQKYLQQNPDESGVIKEIEEFILIPTVKAHVGFNNKILRDMFNQHLAIYKRQYKDKAVINKYIPSVETSHQNLPEN